MQVPAPFEYERATSVEDALARLARLGSDARVIAGGHSLLPMMKLRLATPEHLVDINDLHDELGYVRQEDGELRIGALTRHRELLESELLGELSPIFHDAERVIADPLVRNRGTIGGGLCQADPSEDLSAVCTAVQAQAVIRGAAGVAVWMDAGTIVDAGVGLSALGAKAMRSPLAEDALRGQRPSDEVFAEAGRMAAQDSNPRADQRGGEDYKRHLAAELTTRAVRRAVERALR